MSDELHAIGYKIGTFCVIDPANGRQLDTTEIMARHNSLVVDNTALRAELARVQGERERLETLWEQANIDLGKSTKGAGSDY